MTIHAAKSMVKPGATIEFKPQWLTTNATYDKKITIIRGTVVQLYKHHFLVQMDCTKECFCYSDIVTGYITVK